MIRLTATFTLLLALTAPVLAASGSSRQETQPPRQHEYWLSQDMQRLVFWQSPAQGSSRR